MVSTCLTLSQQLVSYPRLRPKEKSLDTSDWNDNDIEKPDFGSDINLGGGEISYGFFAKEGLPLQDSVQAKEIKARFPHRFCFVAGMEFSVSLDKKIVIPRIEISARKVCNFGSSCAVDFDEEGGPNNGVTVAHIISELHCTEYQKHIIIWGLLR